jgi:tryptophan halogenase
MQSRKPKENPVMSEKPIKRIVILGGGSAGWLTAGVIAAEHQCHKNSHIQVTLIESPNVATIGVGEGTWPTMRATLKKMGVSETELFTKCDASFKQGAKFAKWVSGADDDYYYHPLVLPVGFHEIDLVGPWQNQNHPEAFGDAVCFQGALCEAGRAPKQIKTPEYDAIANYAYHLNSEKLGLFLKKHCTEKLGVKNIVDHVERVVSADNGDIAALATAQHGDIEGDLFIDCSGFASVLLGGHYGISFLGKKHILFNDCALAVQVPYSQADDPIASHTISTAHQAGWIWDIGLPTRRGVGCVYSSAHCSDEEAYVSLVNYINATPGYNADELSIRKIPMKPGHRAQFWHRNCVAVGMSAGFIEPLEASALVLVEMSAAMISAELPANREVMDIVAKRFNRRVTHYWDTIIEFLKLHYVLTQRNDSDYWRDHLRQETVPAELTERLHLWRYQTPNKYDFPLAEEMFPAASWQYVLYGMGFRTSCRSEKVGQRESQIYFDKVNRIKAQLLNQLPSNRELINKIHQFGLQKI